MQASGPELPDKLTKDIVDLDINRIGHPRPVEQETDIGRLGHEGFTLISGITKVQCQFEEDDGLDPDMVIAGAEVVKAAKRHSTAFIDHNWGSGPTVQTQTALANAQRAFRARRDLLRDYWSTGTVLQCVFKRSPEVAAIIDATKSSRSVQPKRFGPNNGGNVQDPGQSKRQKDNNPSNATGNSNPGAAQASKN